MKPRRGRPPNSSRRATREADAAIGRSVWQLLAWGYPLMRPNGIAETVGRAALKEFGRAGHGTINEARPLGDKMVKLIYHRWMRTGVVQTGWVRNGQRIALPADVRPWEKIQADSLRARSPSNHTLEQLATILLRNGGTWPYPELLPQYPGDKQFTAKFAAMAYRPTPDTEKRAN